MLPHDLEPKKITLPPGAKDGIVLITGGTSLHFLHFGYRIQQEFPGMVRAWFAKAPLPPRERALHYRLNGFLRRPGKASKKALRIIEEIRGCIDRVRFSGVLGDYNKEERSVFLADAQRLKPFAEVQPQLIAYPGGEELAGTIKKTGAYFLLVLGGPLVGKEVLESVRGVAVNQHDGWAPEVRGALSVDVALYNRRIDWIGNTVHLMDTGADSGPILRRSLITLAKDETLWGCFFRTIALGTEMVVETVQQMLTDEEIYCFPQPTCGRTFLCSDITPRMRRFIIRDLLRGWLAYAIEKEADF